jgi:hypothetical protein
MYPLIHGNKKVAAITLSLLATFIIFLHACGGGVDPHSEPEPSVETEQELQIHVTSVDGEELSGFDLTIDGPTTFNQMNIGQSTFIIDELSTGEYHIQVSKDGYLSSGTMVEIIIPEEESISHYDEVALVLQERTPPVSISVNEGGMVQTAPSYESEIEGEMIVFSFDPDAIPGEMADESGQVQFSADRLLPFEIDENYEGTVQSYIQFDPELVDLNQPVTIDIPVKSPSGAYNGELTYTLQPGNIPLEVVEAEQSMLLASGNSGYSQQMRANAPGLQNSAVVVNIQVRQSVSWTDFEHVVSGGCGEDVTVNHMVQSGDAGPLAQENSNLASRLSGQTYTLEKEFNGIPNRILSVEVRNRVTHFTVRELPSGNVIEESEVNVKPIQFRKVLSECHDSGGG